MQMHAASVAEVCKVTDQQAYWHLCSSEKALQLPRAMKRQCLKCLLLFLTHEQASGWTHFYYDPVANLKAFSTCLHTCDLYGDGDWRLAVAGLDKNLKASVYARLASAKHPASIRVSRGTLSAICRFGRAHKWHLNICWWIFRVQPPASMLMIRLPESQPLL